MGSERQALVDEIRRCGRAVMLSNHTMETFAAKATPKQAGFLLDLFHTEMDYREENKRRRLYKKAAFPMSKSFEEYDWSKVKLPENLSKEDLLDCSFIAGHRNLVLYGPVGTGKTHMSVAVGSAACDMGYHVRFTTTSELVLKLLRAKEDGVLDKILHDYLSADLIILDEWGYVPVDRESARLLFQVVSQCYETKSLLLTTNLEFSKWGSVLTDDQMAAAMIDRLAHHGHLIIFEGESYRMKHALMRE